MINVFYHGGPRGLRTILPPERTGALCTSDLVGGIGPHSRSKVYVTTSLAAATLYAAGHARGVVYEVEPRNPKHDPDCSMPGLSFQCDRARVIRVHKQPGKVLRRARSVITGAE